MLYNVDSINKEAVEGITGEIGDVLSQAALKIGVLKTTAVGRNKETSKKGAQNSNRLWFKEECRQKRATYRKWQRADKIMKDCEETKREISIAFRNYKRTVTKCFSRYVRDAN